MTSVTALSSWGRVLALITPFLLCGVLAVFVQRTEWQHTAIQLRLGLDTTLFLFGAVLSLSALFVSLSKRRTRRRIDGAIGVERELARVEHRRFAERLDHELKNPLSAMRLGIESLRNGIEGASERTDINNLDRQIQRMVTLTTDLRRIGQFDHHEVLLERVTVASLFDDLKDMADGEALLNRRRTQFAVPTAPWPVPDICADRDLMLLALYNILSNAAKYSRDGDTIAVSASEANHGVHITVADTGIGIPNPDVASVWGELYRGRNAKAQPGNGIGLALVKRIIDRHNGRVRLESKEGQGTRVTIELPAAEAVT